MNSILRLLWCLVLILPPVLIAADAPPQEFRPAERLMKDGNYGEALAALKALLLAQDTPGLVIRAALPDALKCLGHLGQLDDVEPLLEAVVKQHPQDWRVLLAAADGFAGLDHDGVKTKEKFSRAGGEGRHVTCEAHDRVRGLQLLLEARARLLGEASLADKEELLQRLVEVWQGGRPAWKLQILTDLGSVPDYGDLEQESQREMGHPVDAQGRPVFFAVPASYDKAANDGERLRLALKEWAALSPAHALGARASLALLAQQWFSVSTLAGLLHSRDVDVGAVRSSILAVQTLADDETTARTAVGPQRFRLPADYAFVKILRELTALPESAATRLIIPGSSEGAGRRTLRNHLIDELTTRRQFSQSAEVIRAEIKAEKDRDIRKYLQSRLAQIVEAWGRFEPLAAQPAGTQAKLPLVFRNGTTASFTARRVDVAKLLAETKTYIQGEPRQPDERINLENLGQRLMGKGGDRFLSKPVAAWTQDLQPAANHMDRRIEVETPLSEGGAYLIEATFDKTHPTRALLWLESLAIVKTYLGKTLHYFVCDAVTGSPVPEARLAFFGYDRKWAEGKGILARDRWRYQLDEFSTSTDGRGVSEIDSKKLADKEWFVTATDAAGRIAFQGFEHFYAFREDSDKREADKVYIVTDRPVYRPGQEMKWKAWIRRASYDPKAMANPFAKATCKLGIADPRNEELVHKDVQLDEWGSVEGTFTLAADAPLGVYQLGLGFDDPDGRRPSAALGFRVEEYKKPEFEVKIDTPPTPVALGDAFEFTIKAAYYFGGAVQEGQVKYKVTRSPHTGSWFPPGPWDWLFGAGYGWRSNSYRWYPGAANWSVCRTPSPWLSWQGEPPETIAEGETAIGADGVVKVKIDSALAKALHGDQDHRYELTAEVTDRSRRTIFGKSSVLCARHAFEAYLQMNQGAYATGERAEVHVEARTLDGRAVKAGGTLRVFSLRYDADGKPQETQVFTTALKLGESDPPAPVSFLWPAPGQYRVEATLTDAAQHTITASEFTLVQGAALETKNLRFDDLEVIATRDEYQPGDEVELLINTNRPGSTVALFLRDMRHAPIWLKLEGRSTTHRFKLTAADQPNVFVEAYTVSNAELHRQTRQIIVPPRKRIATVELLTDKAAYLPQDQAKVTLRVKDQDGRPFVGQVLLTAYDKALEYISDGSNVEDIRPFFWGWKRSQSAQIFGTMRNLESGLQKKGEDPMTTLGNWDRNVTLAIGSGGYSAKSYLSRGLRFGTAAVLPDGVDGLLSASATAAAAPVMPPPQENRTATSGSDAQPSAPVMIRSHLADSAVWVTNARTNADGEAVLDFPMPDNLTTWKLRSWVIGTDSQVGETAVEVLTRKDLMVRLQAPRFFIEKDEVVLSANVHNETGNDLPVQADLLIEGAQLIAAGDEGRLPVLRHNVPAHGEQRFDWRVKVMQPGEAKITVKAVADGFSDAMQMTIPVHEHGTLKTDSRSLSLRGDQASGTMTFTVPAERKPGSAALELRYSPTLAMAMIDALPYLAGYPYGCTEQTLNRFVPTVITLGVLKDLGINLGQVQDKLTNLNAQQLGDPKQRAAQWQQRDENRKLREAVFDEAEVRKMARAGLHRLAAMRNDDQGWGWFPGGRDSSAHITATVVHGLIVASGTRLLGGDDDIIKDGLDWLQKHENRELHCLKLPEKHRDYKAGPDNTDALVHAVLVEGGRGDAAMRQRLYDQRNDLSRYSVALLGLACHRVKETERRDMCLRNLRQFVKQDDENQTAHIELPREGWWHWWNDEMETQAAFLKLLCTADPRGALAARTAKYLLNNRRHAACWNSTRDTALVIESLAVFLKASGEARPDLTLDVVIDGQVRKQVRVTSENLFAFDNALTLSGDEVTTGEHRIELRRTGTSPLYANASLTLFSKEDMVPAAGLEVKVERKFYKITERKTKASVAGARGQVIAQQGSKDDRTELASGTPLQSGDLVEIELHIDSKNDYDYVLIADPKPAGFEAIEVRSGWNYEGMASYQEYRDDRVAFFAETLPRGHHVLSYRVKAEIPGRFSALPTKAEAMYAPELRGNASEWKARIDDGAEP